MNKIDELIHMYPATDLMPLIKEIKSQGLGFDVLYHAIRIFVVRMPLNLGGTPLGGYWSREYAESLIQTLKDDSAWQHEIAFRKEINMEPVGEFVIEEIPLAALGCIGG